MRGNAEPSDAVRISGILLPPCSYGRIDIVALAQVLAGLSGFNIIHAQARNAGGERRVIRGVEDDVRDLSSFPAEVAGQTTDPLLDARLANGKLKIQRVTECGDHGSSEERLVGKEGGQGA